MQYREGKILIAESDGETVMVNTKSGGQVPLSSLPEEAQERFNKKAKWTTRLYLYFTIPILPFPNAVWCFESGGEETTCDQIPDVFDTALAECGTLKGEHFVLSVKIHTSETTGNKFPVVSLTHVKPQKQNENEQLSILYDTRQHIGAGND